MITIRNKEGLIKALCEYKEFTYGGHVKAWEWDKTFTIQDYNTVLLVKYNGALIFAKKRKGDFVEFIKCNKLPQEISLKLGNVYYGLETKLLRGED